MHETCKPEFCGNSLCNENLNKSNKECFVETSITPFTITIDIQSDGSRDVLDDSMSLKYNTGMCIRFKQVPCKE